MKNLFNRIASRFRTKGTGVALVETNTFTGFDNFQDTANLKQYKESLYLYIAVSKIAKRGAGVPFELYRIKNLKGDTVEVMEHPIIDVFNSPNPLMTRREFFEVSLAHYLLSGDCFWYVAREGGQVVGLMPLRPDYVQVLISNDRTSIIGYEYTNVQVTRFAPEDIVHIKNIDPTNLLRGVGASRPAMQRIVSEKEATFLQGKFFKNSGVPSVLVFMNVPLTKEGVEEGRANWNQTFRRDGEQVGFFGENTKDVKPLAISPREMDFIASQDKLRNDILAAFGVPLPMVDLKDIERANSREAYRMFLQEAVIPALSAFEDSINHRLIPQVDSRVFLSFPDPTPFDREQMLTEATGLKKAGIITANEARALFNYEPMEGHDELAESQPNFSMNENTKAVRQKAKDVLRSRPVLVKRLEAAAAVAKALTTTPKRQMKSIFATKALKQDYAKAYNSRVDRKADTFKDALDDFHRGLEERILASDLTPGLFMDLVAEKALAKATFGPLMQRLYKEGGEAALDALFRKADDQFFTNEELLASIDGRAAFFANSIMDTTFEVLRNKIVDGVANGDGIDKIGRSIRDYFTDMSTKRARTIARTETGWLLSKATNDAYSQSAIVTGKEWISVGDDKVREEHVDNDGAIVAKDEAFPNGEHYPAEHSVNCRCVLAPAL